MKGNIALATSTFALLGIVVGIAVHIALELLGATSTLAGQAGTCLVAIPWAVFRGHAAQ